MKTANSKELVTKIMGLNAPVMATAESGGGFFGMTGYRQQALLDLKKITASYATESQKSHPDQVKTKELTDQIEAGLPNLYALNIVDEKKLQDILALLDQ